MELKIAFFILLVSVSNVLAIPTYSQVTKVSLNMQNKSLEQVMDEIERQSEFYFIFNQKQIDVNRVVDIQVENKLITDILPELFKSTNVNYAIFDKKILLTTAPLDNNLLAIASVTNLQQRQIAGKVTSETGDPLTGVSVSVKGTTVGITTGIDGKYTLSIPANATTLVFSFVGMGMQEISITTENVYNVVMTEESKALDEVVVIGYGTQKKVNLTGAVSSIKIDDKLINHALPNVSSGMAGLVPGLSVVQNSGMAGKNDVTLLIRGLGTVNNANPLIVVDGMPDVDINRLNMNDIESISVLKDAASAAVYGSRAANGVILITTKTGKGQIKPRLEISSSYALENPTQAYEFMADYPRALTLHQRAAAVNTLPVNLYFKKGTIDQWMAMGMIDPLRYPNTDWWKMILRNGLVKTGNVSASGGSDKSNFFLSMGLMNENGLEVSNDFSRYNVRFNYDYNILNNMSVGAKFGGNWSKYVYSLEDGFSTNAGGGDMSAAIAGITPYDPVTGYYGGVMAYNEDPQAYNPYEYAVNLVSHQNRQEANPSMFWNWTPIKGLTARIDYALSYYNQFTWSANMPAIAYNFQTKSFGTRVYTAASPPVSNITATGYKTQLNGRLNYQVTVAHNHNINAMVAYSQEYWYDRTQSASRNDRLYPTLHEIDAALTDIQSNGGNSSAESLRSYIGRLEYSSYDKYLFEFNFRYDGSSKFLPGHQFGFFPSAALGWRFNKENFVKSFTENWLTYGKLRFSYGSLGNNSGVGRYEQQETLTTNNYMISASTNRGFVNSKMINQNLSWESTQVMNLGLDLGFLKNRLMIEIDYYDRLTTGMNSLSDMSLLLSGAYSAPRTNIGNLRNRGIEGNITWKDGVGDFSYSINLTASHNRTTLEKWSQFLTRGNIFLNMPYHFLYIYNDIGIAQTWQDVYNATPQGAQPGDILRKDLNGDGLIDGNDMKAYPNVQRDRPTTNFSLNGNISWKGIDLSVFFQGASGRKDIWLNAYNNVNPGLQRYAFTWDHWYNTWSIENRYGGWPRLGGNNNVVETNFWLDDLSYFRLKNVQIGYTLSVHWLQKLRISNVRIYGSGANLFVLTKFRGLDPEKEGAASLAYPLNKSYLIGINIGF